MQYRRGGVPLCHYTERSGGIMSRLLDVVTLVVLVGVLAVGGRTVADRWSADRARSDRPVDQWEELASGPNRIGPKDAPVVLVEFVDYECPACRTVSPMVDRVAGQFGKGVAVVYRNWPLATHPAALPAAIAVECAAIQGRFGEFHSLLLTRTGWMATLDFATLAEEASMPSIDRFRACVANRETEVQVDRDIALAMAIEGRGTPAVVLNGTYLQSVGSEEELVRRIERLLNAR